MAEDEAALVSVVDGGDVSPSPQAAMIVRAQKKASAMRRRKVVSGMVLTYRCQTTLPEIAPRETVQPSRESMLFSRLSPRTK
jgi:hypothetical protein